MARGRFISAQVVGLRRELRELRDLGDRGRDALREVIDETADALVSRARRNLQRNDTIASGELAGSIEKRGPKREGGQGFGTTVVVDAPHAQFIEFGTKARGAASPLPSSGEIARQTLGYVYGLEPSPLPPLPEIAAWAAIRGIPQEAVYPIARKIATEGIEAQPFFFAALEGERNNARKRARDAARRVAGGRR